MIVNIIVIISSNIEYLLHSTDRYMTCSATISLYEETIVYKSLQLLILSLYFLRTTIRVVYTI